MSEVSYGGVSLTLVKTNGISQEPVYSDDGTEYLYTRFGIDVSCVHSFDIEGVNPAALDALLRQTLLKPRLPFVMTVDGNELISVGAPDIAGGPYPRDLHIKQITGNNIMMVNFRIDCHRQDCIQELQEVVSNRYEISHEYDQNAYCTRRVSGQLVANGILVGRTIDRSAVRAFVVPALPHGWVRESMSFMPRSDGLRLNYQIVDKEVYRVPPTRAGDPDRVGATKAQASFTLRSGHWGVTSFADISVVLEGSKATPKHIITKQAFAIALSRTRLQVPPGQQAEDFGPDILEQVSVTEELFENKVSLNLTVRKVKEMKVGFAGMMDIGRFCLSTVPDTETNQALIPGVLGTAGIAALTAAWKEPCGSGLPNEAAGIGGSAIQGSLTNDPNVSVLPSTAGEVADATTAQEETKATTEHQNSPYDESRQKQYFEWKANQQKLQAVIAGSSADLTGAAPSSEPDSSKIISVGRPTTKGVSVYEADRFRKYPDHPWEVERDYVAKNASNGNTKSTRLVPSKSDVEVGLGGLHKDGKTQKRRVRVRQGIFSTKVIDPSEYDLDVGSSPIDGNPATDNAKPAQTARPDLGLPANSE